MLQQDDHAKDVLGASGAGWRTIWCPANQAWDAGGPVSVAMPPPDELGEADARVANEGLGLAQIPAIVQGWDAAAERARL
eukprot:COSAG04_NODE_5621_length_1548_cov_1.331953_3_plen_80_part_00